MESNGTNRFADRVDNYIKYRPHYPQEVYDFLFAENIISTKSIIADIGSGTGISAEPLLKMNLRVFGVEPNKEMRDAGEKLLQQYTNFISVDGTAENTGLPNSSIDAILVGQAFHWFDKIKSKIEFKRILKPGGITILMWNDRRTEETEFLRSYEDFLQLCGTDYKKVNHKNTQDKKVFEDFFGKPYHEKWFYSFQEVDFSGLTGRVLSSSYMPNQGHKDYEHMMYCLRKVFQRYQENGKVRLDYDTKIYYAKLN